MFPFEFTVVGTPLSHQTRNRQRLVEWRRVVRAVAARRWNGSPPTVRPVSFQVTYYYEGTPLDVDNMIKPIQDALNGLVYEDDSQITDTSGHRRDINSSFRIRGMSPAVAEAFVTGAEFIHVRVELDPDQERLP